MPAGSDLLTLLMVMPAGAGLLTLLTARSLARVGASAMLVAVDRDPQLCQIATELFRANRARRRSVRTVAECTAGLGGGATRHTVVSG